jgi:uncharacterized protein YdhG (YjbR/CyaY superfamily)
MPTRTTKKPTAKTAAPKTVAAYLAAAPEDKRAVLTKLRKTIKAAAPKASEILSYGIVGYKQNGQRLVYFGYWKGHYALYAAGGFVDTHPTELKGYEVHKSTIRFPADKPIPHRLVTKLVKARLAEIENAG